MRKKFRGDSNVFLGLPRRKILPFLISTFIIRSCTLDNNFSIKSSESQLVGVLDIKLLIGIFTNNIIENERKANVFTNNLMGKDMGVNNFEMGLNVSTNFGQQVCCRPQAAWPLKQEKVCTTLSF